MENFIQKQSIITKTEISDQSPQDSDYKYLREKRVLLDLTDSSDYSKKIKSEKYSGEQYSNEFSSVFQYNDHIQSKDSLYNQSSTLEAIGNGNHFSHYTDGYGLQRESTTGDVSSNQNKTFVCEVCKKEFDHHYTLTRHLPIHFDIRKFICDECGKSFRQSSTLSQHRAIHSMDRPFICEVCKKNFNRVSTLISHRKTHSSEKPYNCHICSKSFHQKGKLILSISQVNSAACKRFIIFIYIVNL